MSIHITQNILNRLINGKALTPIEDIEDAWEECLSVNGEKIYQCKRMSSLFKRIDEDGNVTYSDNNRCCMKELNSNTIWNNRLVTQIYDEMFPISFPYNAPDKRDEVVCTEFLTDRANGDFDTIGVLYIERCNGNKIPIHRYFKESENGWDEIGIHEYDMRREKHYARINTEKRVNNMDTSAYEHFIENLRAKLESKIKGIVAIRTVDEGKIILHIYSPDNFIHSYCLKNVHEMIQDNDGLDKVINAVLEEYEQYIIRQYFY